MGVVSSYRYMARFGIWGVGMKGIWGGQLIYKAASSPTQHLPAIMADHWQRKIRLNHIEYMLKVAYAKCLLKLTRAGMSLGDALELVHDSQELHNTWMDLLSQMNPPASWPEYSKYSCVDWRFTHWITPEWMDEIQKMMAEHSNWC